MNRARGWALHRRGWRVGRVGFIGCLLVATCLFACSKLEHTKPPKHRVLKPPEDTTAIAQPIAAGKESPEEKPIWLVVTRPMFVEALQPLVEHRRRDGFEPVVSTQPIAEALAALDRPPSAIFLVGDDDTEFPDMPWSVPTNRFDAFQLLPDDSPVFVSDVPFGDLDRDGRLDVPVGRLPVRRPLSVRRVVEKIIAYETRSTTLDDLRFPIWAATPNFGPQIDSLATTFLLNTVSSNGAGWEELWVMTADRRHPLSYPDGEEARLFHEQLHRGGLLVAMFGHGNRDRFLSRYVHGGFFRWPRFYDRVDAWNGLAAGHPAPPLFIFACFCGDFSGGDISLSEMFLSMSGGPVAVVAPTTWVHPAMNYYSGISLLKSLDGRRMRLGDLVLTMQANVFAQRNWLLEQLSQRFEKRTVQSGALDWSRRVHHRLFAILGDPATSLRVPQPLEVIVEPCANGWHWKVTKPATAAPATAATLHVGLRPPQPPLTRSIGTPAMSFEEANATFCFDPVDERAADAPWEGVLHGHGTIRFVALTDRTIYAAVVDLTETRPAAMEPDAAH